MSRPQIRKNERLEDATAGDVQRIALQNGFAIVSSPHERTEVYEKQGVRLKINRLGPASYPLQCEFLIVNQEKLLPFVLPHGGAASGAIVFCGEQIRCTAVATNSKEYQAIVWHLNNLLALINDEKLSQECINQLSPLPQLDALGDHLDPAVMHLLRQRLGQFRCLRLFSTNAQTLVSYISALGVRQAYEVKPWLLTGCQYTHDICRLLEKVSPLNETLVVVNLDLPDERSLATYFALGERLNMLPEFTGARILLCHSKEGTGQAASLPFIRLPDLLVAKHGSMLDETGIQADQNNLITAEKLLASGMSAEVTIKNLKESARLDKPANVIEHSLRFDRPRQRQTARSTLTTMVPAAEAIFQKHLVGHQKMGQEMVALLSFWFMLAQPPLCLAFIGPSGTGKNHTGELIAKILQGWFETERPHVVSYNAGSHVGRNSIWNLTGTQKGLVFSEEPGLLHTLRDGSVLCFDEVDKLLHGQADLQDFLISLLDDNTWRDGHGTLHRLPQCVILLTMNAGMDAAGEQMKQFGFSGTPVSTEKRVQACYREFFEKNIHPALRGRIQKPFFFPPLREKDLLELGRRGLAAAQNEIEQLGLRWPLADIEQAARELMRASDRTLGARGIKSQVEAMKIKIHRSLFRQQLEAPPDLNL